MLDVILVSESDLSDLYEDVLIGPPIGTSDHKCLFLYPKLQRENKDYNIKEFTDFRKHNIGMFRNELLKFDFNSLYNEKDLDKKVNLFQNAIENAVSSVPKYIVKIKNNNAKPWITTKIIHLINQKWTAYRQKNWNFFNKLKLQVKNEVKEAKIRWAAKSKNNARSMWDVVNSSCGKNRVGIDTVLGSYIDPKSAANDINNTFSAVFSTKEEFQLPNLLNDWCDLVTPEWTFRELSKLNISKSSGSDLIQPRVLANAADILSEPLTHIIN